jgi:hypothetical protein
MEDKPKRKITMNQQERRLLGEFPEGLDKAVTEKFGISCETKFDFFGSFNHVTTFGECDEQTKKQVEIYIEGFMAGNKELSNRLMQ